MICKGEDDKAGLLKKLFLHIQSDKQVAIATKQHHSFSKSCGPTALVLD
jgi:hypothetical protein